MTKLCHSDEISEGGAKSLSDGERQLFAVKKDGEIFLYENLCPHLGVELNWMPDQFLDMDSALIQCATHGALFLINSGECVAGPCQGQSLQAVPFELVAGEVRLKI